MKRYRVKELIGTGGGGEVHRARLGWLGWFGSNVAVKTLSLEQSKDIRLAMRLQNEAAVLSELDHPNIVHLYDVHRRRDGRLVLVLEYVDGLTLAELAQGGPLTVEAVLQIGRCLIDGLACGHKRGLIHRDVSSRNVLVSWQGQVKLADFGLAKTIGSAVTTDAEHSGTLPYIAPEQVQGLAPDARADLFAVGALMYLLTTGRPPFAANTLGEARSQLLAGPPPSTEPLPAVLSPLIGKLLARERSERFQNCDEARAAWPDIDGQDELVAILQARRGPTTPPARNPLAMPAAAILTAAAGLAGGAAYVHSRGEPTPNSATVEQVDEPATPPEQGKPETLEPSVQPEPDRAQSNKQPASATKTVKPQGPTKLNPPPKSAEEPESLLPPRKLTIAMPRRPKPHRPTTLPTG